MVYIPENVDMRCLRYVIEKNYIEQLKSLTKDGWLLLIIYLN